MNQLEFVKLHGNGNDFILIDELNGKRIPDDEKNKAARILCHRNFGVGCDGLLFLVPSEKADIGMRLFQPDGSEAEMCGNGIRCLAKHAWENGYVGEIFSVETLAGVIPIQVRRDLNRFLARVEMGIPRFERPEIPAEGEGLFMNVPIHGFEVSAVNTGVPHAVIFVESLDIPVERLAPKIRHSLCFPEGANVNFVRLGKHLEVRTFERGVEAETLSCGTGSVAAAAVARRLGLVGDSVEVRTRGGPLHISFVGERAFMEGPAVTVCRGIICEEILQ